jgi:hypothetical protein
MPDIEITILLNVHDEPGRPAKSFRLMVYTCEAGYCAAHVFSSLATESNMGIFACRAVFAALLVSALYSARASAQIPDAIAAPRLTKVLEVHAEGAQIYECKAGADKKLAWQFREPIAALILDGKTVGRHYLGPSWELSDGSAVSGKVAARAPGNTAKDIPALKLDAVSHHGSGQLGDVTTIQRLNTKGGMIEGECPSAGALISVPYSSDYVFLK